MEKGGREGFAKEREKKSPVGRRIKNRDQCSSFLFRFFLSCILQTANNSQHVKVGIVGGSDLVKISEQLGENSELFIIGRGTKKEEPFLVSSVLSVFPFLLLPLDSTSCSSSSSKNK